MWREQLGGAVGAHAVQRRAGLALAESPSLWQIEQAPVKSTWPFAASPGFSTSGSSAATMSLFAFAAGESVSSSAAACSATCRFGCVRSRATLAGPRFAGVTFPSFDRGEQRERGVRTLQDLIEQRRRVGARQRRDEHGIHIAAGSLAERGDQAAFERRRHSGVRQHRPIAESACGRRAGTRAGWRRCRRGARRSSRRRRDRAA